METVWKCPNCRISTVIVCIEEDGKPCPIPKCGNCGGFCEYVTTVKHADRKLQLVKLRHELGRKCSGVRGVDDYDAIDAFLAEAYRLGKEDERKDAIAFLEFSPAYEILPAFRARSI